MAIAQLSIDIVAKLAEFQQDMRRAAAEADKGTAEIRKSLDGLKSFAGEFVLGLGAGMAAAFSVGVIKEFITANVDAADELNRLSQSTGVSVEKLSQWGAVARRNGLDVQDLSEQINEFQANLSDVSDDTEGAGYALKQLGLDYKSVKEMSSEDAFTAVAEALSKVEDSGKKAAMAMALGGDEYQKYIAVLNAIGAGGLEAAAITTQYANDAAALKDQISGLSIAGQAWGQSIVNGITPALTEAAMAITEVISGTGGMTDEARKLAQSGALKEFARDAIDSLTHLMDAGENLIRLFRHVRQTIGADMALAVTAFDGYGDAAKQAISGNFSAAAEAARSTSRQLSTITADANATLESIWADDTMGARIRKRLEEVRRATPAGPTPTPRSRPDYDAVKAKEAAKKAEEAAKASAAARKKALDEAEKLNARAQAEYEKLITSIRGKTEADRAELDGTAAVTDGQKMALDVMTQLRDGRLKLSDSQKLTVSGYLEELLTAEKLNDAQKASAQWIEESGAANLKLHEDIMQRTQSLQDQVEAEKRTTESYGLSAEALTALTQARQLDTALALASRAAAMDGLPGYEQMTAEWQAQADAIREVIKQQQIRIDLEGMDAKDPYKGARQGIKDYLKDISAASDAAKSVTTKMLGSVEDELTSLVTTGQFNWKSLINSMISEALRLSVVRPMMSAFLNSSAGSSTASLIGNMVSVGASFFGGVGSAGNAGYGDYSSAGLAAAFGGGRANGGPVGAGTLYDVNERGVPEVLTVGARTMLMMGAEGGTVTPLTGLNAITSSSVAGASGSGGASQPVIHQTFNFGGADTVTRAEMQRAAAAAKDAALSEWQNNRARGVRGYA